MALDALAAIERRTSIRRFRPDPVPRADIERLLSEPLEQVVVGDVLEIRPGDPGSPEAVAAAGKKRRETLATPAVLVAMYAVSPDEITREEDYAATMMALQNFMIGAVSLGLGTYLRTGGLMRNPGLADLVRLPDGYRVAGIVSVGYPAAEEPPRRRRAAAEMTAWLE